MDDVEDFIKLKGMIVKVTGNVLPIHEGVYEDDEEDEIDKNKMTNVMKELIHYGLKAITIKEVLNEGHKEHYLAVVMKVEVHINMKDTTYKVNI